LTRAELAGRHQQSTFNAQQSKPGGDVMPLQETTVKPDSEKAKKDAPAAAPEPEKKPVPQAAQSNPPPQKAEKRT
jgi:hypothetical protein